MSKPSTIFGETQQVWICVLKVSDFTGPRRRADRPRVVVKALRKRPGLELDRWVKTSRRAKRMSVVNVVYEVMPHSDEPGTSARYLYVGQTSQPLEDRIRQHREGHHNPKGQRLHSLACHKRFVRPRFDLLPEQFRQTFYCQEDALTAEADLRLAMEAEGFVVDGGTEKLSMRRRELGIDGVEGVVE